MSIKFIAIGIAICIVLLVIILIPRVYENFFILLTDLSDEAVKFPITDQDQLLVDAPWKKIGDSAIEPAVTTLPDISRLNAVPIFKTLRADVIKIGPAKWRFKVRFLFKNSLKQEIVVDDMHTRVYEKDVPTPAYMTIKYRGDVLLLQDNTIWKDNKSYSLKSNDGYEIVIVLEMTRIEGSPLYGPDHVRDGPVRTIFGLIIDYYYVDGIDVKRGSLPSDCIYLFEYKNNYDWEELKAIDSVVIEEIRMRHVGDSIMTPVVQRLEGLLTEHLSFRLTPKS